MGRARMRIAGGKGMRTNLEVAAFFTAMALAGASEAPAAECAPEKMVRIVMRQEIPAPPPDSFAAKSRTLYRHGAKLGRMEEQLNPQTGVKSLIVVNAPDVWMADLADKTGRHMKDPAPVPRFRAPILLGTEGLPEPLLSFEFGCEIAFMEASGRRVQEKIKIGDALFDRYDAANGRFSAVLLRNVETGTPAAAGVYKDGELDYLVRYLEYDGAMPPDKSLFEKPGEIVFGED